jgi:holo-[acyl-carrier protein] synthase
VIIGIGTDIVQIDRIQGSIDRNGTGLARRVLTDRELEKFQVAPNPAAYLAKRFAAKEAASKAFGTGIGKIGWHDLEVVNDEMGAPAIVCHGVAKDLLAHRGADTVHLSIADESDAAVAFVVISRSSAL